MFPNNQRFIDNLLISKFGKEFNRNINHTHFDEKLTPKLLDIVLKFYEKYPKTMEEFIKQDFYFDQGEQ